MAQRAVAPALRRAIQLRALLRRRVVVALPFPVEPRRASTLLLAARGRRPCRKAIDSDRGIAARHGAPRQRRRHAGSGFHALLARAVSPRATARDGTEPQCLDEATRPPTDRH